MELSNIIYKVTRKHRVPAKIYTAILMQESGYRLEARGCYKGIAEVISGDPNATVEHKEIKVCQDFGLSQIYYKTAKAYNFDLSRLTTDLEYSIEAGAIVLSDFKKRYEHREVDYWTRYNASSRSKRNIYKRLVQRYF